MARIRTIKPEFPQSESMGNVCRDARLCFIELWTIADDEGRLRGSSRMLANLLFPYDADALGLIDGWLGELERENCICRYEIDGHRYIQINNWHKQQKIDQPTASRLPPVPTPIARRLPRVPTPIARPRELVENPPDLVDNLRLGREGKGRDLGKDLEGPRARGDEPPLSPGANGEFLAAMSG